MPIGRSNIGQQILKPGKKKTKSFLSINKKNHGGKNTGTNKTKRGK
jgi:hypothetical protein